MTRLATDPFWESVRTYFHRAVDLPRHEREPFLDRECIDAAARAEVESLLAAHDGAGSFLERSIWDLIDSNDPQQLSGRTIGAYQIVRPLGHGGMGSVFLATRAGADFDQRVAVKLVRGGASGEALVRRFRQERQILAALEHPNIARLLDGGTTAEGLPYLVMEYVDGIAIDEYCRQGGLPESDRLRLFLQLCDAVQHAHRSLVIHRDLKPGNVLVTPGGVLKLLDFGIAKLTTIEMRSDAPATRLMTPEYASPEQLDGKPVTTASDVYSLGVLLCELLTGERPSLTTRSLRGDLANIVAMAIESDPSRRYGSVEKFADDIRRYLDGHPVAARRATFFYRSSKFVRRNTLAVVATMAIVATVAIAFAATLHQKRVAERRFEEVRSLARSVVFELHDAIARLPGSTPARALLVQRALVYLDHLAEEAAGNTALQMELGRAYLKIGDVQGLPYSANLGDTGAAMKSYGKALTIVGPITDREPSNTAALTLLADAHDRLGLVNARALHWLVSLREHQTSLAIRRTLPHDVDNDFAEARTLVAIGDCMYVGKSQIKSPTPSVPLYLQALDVLARVPDSGPRRVERLREVARAHQHLGSAYTNPLHDIPRALEHHAAATRALEECMRLSPNDDVARRNYADQLVMTATAQIAMRDARGALDGIARALPIFNAIAAVDEKNSEAQHDLAFAYDTQAIAYEIFEQWDDAQQSAEKVLAIRERLIAGDATNREDRRDLQRTYAILSHIDDARGRTEAANAWREKMKANQRELAR